MPVPKKRSRRDPVEEPVGEETPVPSRPTPRALGSKGSRTTVSVKGKGKAPADLEVPPVVEPSAGISEARGPPTKTIGTAEVVMKNGKPHAVQDSALHEFLRRVQEANPASKIDKDQLLAEVALLALVSIFLSFYFLFLFSVPLTGCCLRLIADLRLLVLRRRWLGL